MGGINENGARIRHYSTFDAPDSPIQTAAGIGAALAVSYGVLYVILLSQDYALLLGSLLMFMVLASLMLATRRLNWAAIRDGE